MVASAPQTTCATVAEWLLTTTFEPYSPASPEAPALQAEIVAKGDLVSVVDGRAMPPFPPYSPYCAWTDSASTLRRRRRRQRICVAVDMLKSCLGGQWRVGLKEYAQGFMNGEEHEYSDGTGIIMSALLDRGTVR